MNICMPFNIAIPLLGIEISPIEILSELPTNCLLKCYHCKIGNIVLTVNNSGLFPQGFLWAGTFLSTLHKWIHLILPGSVVPAFAIPILQMKGLRHTWERWSLFEVSGGRIVMRADSRCSGVCLGSAPLPVQAASSMEWLKEIIGRPYMGNQDIV